MIQTLQTFTFITTEKKDNYFRDEVLKEDPLSISSQIDEVLVIDDREAGFLR